MTKGSLSRQRRVYQTIINKDSRETVGNQKERVTKLCSTVEIRVFMLIGDR